MCTIVFEEQKEGKEKNTPIPAVDLSVVHLA